jgi:hypothetical protein
VGQGIYAKIEKEILDRNNQKPLFSLITIWAWPVSKNIEEYQALVFLSYPSIERAFTSKIKNR